MTKRSLIIGFGLALIMTGTVATAAMADAASASAGGVASAIAIAQPACPVFSRSLSIGISGSDVTMLQNYLNAKGYLSVSATGYFGPLTQAAVARWQAQGGVVAQGVSGSGIFGPLSRAYFSRSCNGSGGTTTQSTTFTANPLSGVAPLTVQFTMIVPQGGTVGNLVSFGDGATGTVTMDPTFSSYSAIGIVSHTYASAGTYTATLTGGSCACPANGVCNCPNLPIVATATVTVMATSSIQQMNAPASVTLGTGGIAEVRNESFYFTLASSSASAATIDIMPVGCWNSFPSDTPPEVHCMIAPVLTPPQTLSVGQTYDFGTHPITLTSLNSNGAATFEVQ